MLLIKNDPKYNEQWPRALVPYKRIYGVDEPQQLTPLANDGKLLEALAGRDALRPGRHVEPVQARELSRRRRPQGQGDGGIGPARSLTRPGSLAYTQLVTNWIVQGADAGLYANSDIHAIRILRHGADHRAALHRAGRRFYNHAGERLRILGEFPVRKFGKERRAAARSRRQSRHQLPGQDPGRRRLDLPDARQARHGAEHGADLASASAGRDPQRLRRLPRPQPEADATSRRPPPPGPITTSST